MINNTFGGLSFAFVVEYRGPNATVMAAVKTITMWFIRVPDFSKLRCALYGIILSFAALQIQTLRGTQQVSVDPARIYWDHHHRRSEEANLTESQLNCAVVMLPGFSGIG